MSASPIVTIPQFLSKPSAKPAIICHIPWCFLWPGFLGSPETVPGQACQPSPLWRPLPHIPASNGLFVLTRVPLKKERFAFSLGPDFHPFLSSPPSELGWVMNFVFYEVQFISASFPITLLSFKSTFIQIMWTGLCSFVVKTIFS